jgi:hypothetical protein
MPRWGEIGLTWDNPLFHYDDPRSVPQILNSQLTTPMFDVVLDLSDLSKPALISLAVLVAALPACTATKSVANLEKIQNTEGFYSKSLFYVGSSSRFHYFDQFALLGDWWWVPGVHDDNFRSFRVRKDDLKVAASWIFAHSDYEGDDDHRRVRCRVHATENPHVERRSNPGSKLLEPDNYELRQIDDHRWTVRKKSKAHEP